MKKHNLVIGMLAAISCAPLTIADDYWPSRYSSIGIEGSINDNLNVDETGNEDNLDRYGAFALTFEQQFSEAWGALLSYEYSEPDLYSNDDMSAEISRFAVGLRGYSTLSNSDWRTFAGLGAGYTDVEYKNSSLDNDMPFIRLEGGLQKLLSNRWLTEVGVRLSHEFGDSEDTNWHGFVGLRYLFSATRPKPRTTFVKPPVMPKPKPPVVVAKPPKPVAIPRCTQQDFLGLTGNAACKKILADFANLLPNIQFDTGKSTIKRSEVSKIAAIAKVLRSYPEAQLVLNGHTDNQGNRKFNQRLSEQRSASIKSELVKRFNIEPDRIITSGTGEMRPIADNNSVVGQSTNRRVDALIVYDDLDGEQSRLLSEETAM